MVTTSLIRNTSWMDGYYTNTNVDKIVAYLSFITQTYYN